MKLLRNAFYALLLLTASTCIAQTRGDVVADVPFAFVVAGQTLPAGQYIVSPVTETTVAIREPRHQGMFVMTNAAQRPQSDGSCKLVFHRYENTYFLSEVWSVGQDRGRQLHRSRAEREIAAKGVQQSNTVIAAK